MRLMTYNFTLDENKYRSAPGMVYSTLKDRRNGIETTNIIPGLQCYINYLDLLIMLRDKWISVGYLDLGMIPIIMGPSFMHEALVKSLLPLMQANGLPIYAMPGTSFMLNASMQGTTDYWAFRDDAAKIAECSPERVRTRDVISKVMGVTFDEVN